MYFGAFEVVIFISFLSIFGNAIIVPFPNLAIIQGFIIAINVGVIIIVY